MADEANPERPNPLPRSVPKAAAPVPEDEFSDQNLLKRFVISVRSNRLPKPRLHRRWEALVNNLAIPQEKARELCARFNVDPEELVNRE